jgi:hypothetical protein
MFDIVACRGGPPRCDLDDEFEGKSQMYAVIRNYQNEAPDILEQIRARADAIREVIASIGGFQAYYLLDTQEGGFATIGVFEDRAGAEESTRAAGKWVGENIADWTPNPPTIIQGEVAISITG